MRAKRGKRTLVGLGLDNQDGHVRVTRGRDFHLVGGSEQTHEAMQEKCIKFNEKLDRRGKRLDDLACDELLDVAAECDMPLLRRDRRE
ncbi:MAG: hypothetical protein KGY99_07050 [Phycisphaerae bacterium]|nr:hypothetical protein [Phycisphaerae bacterium]